MPDKSLRNKIKGQSLVEALVAMSVILFGVLGVFTLLTRSLGLNRVVSDRYVATYLASEGVEVIKNIVDSNIIQSRAWNENVTAGAYEVQYDTAGSNIQTSQDRTLFFDPNTKLFQYNGGNTTFYKRTVTTQTLSGGNELQVNSVVDWNSHGGTYSINIEDHFYNWR